MNACAACQNRMEKKKGSIDLRIKGRLFLIKNVEFEECPLCGEKVLSPEVARNLYQLIQEGRYTEERLTVPVLDCA